jgi:class 3 adenylate cyclase
MSAELKSQLRLEIAHVLFIDIVGYSKLLIDEQKELLQELNDIVRKTDQVREAEAEDKLVRLPTGDGMALVFTNHPEAPVECALEISKALQSHPEIKLRMGIHSGAVNSIADVNDRSNVAGAGINIAQRVMNCGDAGHILLSRHVADGLAQYRRWQSHLHDLGEVEVKHGNRLHIFNLYTDELGNREVPEKFNAVSVAAAAGHAEAEQRRVTAATPRSTSKPAVPMWAWIGGAVLILAAIAFGFLILRTVGIPQRREAVRSGIEEEGRRSAASPPVPEKSIAVLPFENRSEDKANAYFADGIQDEILTRLSKIADLKVISRTSTQHYKSAPENLREIASQLGVAHILEGSVQKSKRRRARERAANQSGQ